VLTGRQWATAFVFAATGYYGCYTAMVMAIEAGGAALPTLVMGLTPVSVAVVSNLRTRETSFLSLAGPLVCIGAGLALVNLARHSQGLGGGNLMVCMAASVVALAMLTYYLVANIEFLIRNPGLSPLTWANATGCALLVFALAALGVRLLIGGGLPWEGTPTSATQYAVCCLILGLAVSWLGGVLWNRANALLPPTLAGQCIVFWPLSGIVYAYVLQGAFPGVRETLGMAMVFAGVVWGIKAAGRRGRKR
jgi:drug/metabolite transporter (DMT)-like permease